MAEAREADPRTSLRHVLATEPPDYTSNQTVHSPSQPRKMAHLMQEDEPAIAQVGATHNMETETEMEMERESEKERDKDVDVDNAPDAPVYTATTQTTRRNANGSVSSVYSGNKIRHLKKEDGVPLWRKDIQYDFLNLVFHNDQRVFTRYSDGSKGYTFAEIYVDAMAKSSKCSKILKEKLMGDSEAAINMGMVCLLVNVGRMNTTLNFFPEMRAQLRTYHSIPALQARQDPNAYKQLQDAPRLKSILKGATEDTEQPGTIEEIRAASIPRTNPVNLIFVLSQYAPKISELHFSPPRDFFDLVMRGSLSSRSRATAFLWLCWWYLESDFSVEDSQRNPFGPGIEGPDSEGKEGEKWLPFKVPAFESLTEEQAALENVDTEEEVTFGEEKKKERTAILASEPSPAMTALKRAKKGMIMECRPQQPFQALLENGMYVYKADSGTERERQAELAASDDGFTTPGRDDRSPATYSSYVSTGSCRLPHALGSTHYPSDSERTRSPSPPVPSFSAVNKVPKAATDPRNIDSLLNDEAPLPRPVVPAVKKGPGRGNWRRNKDKALAAANAPTIAQGMPVSRSESQHNEIRPAYGFVHETPSAPFTYQSSQTILPKSLSPHAPLQFQVFQPAEHIPTPNYQASKRNRPPTQHQVAISRYRRERIDFILDRRIRHLHIDAKRRREAQPTIMRAWKRIKLLPQGYDSEEEAGKSKKEADTVLHTRDKENVRGEHETKDKRSKADVAAAVIEEQYALAGRHRITMAGYVQARGEIDNLGEEARYLAHTLRRTGRRMERWEEGGAVGPARKASQSATRLQSQPLQMDKDGIEIVSERPGRRVSYHRGPVAERDRGRSKRELARKGIDGRQMARNGERGWTTNGRRGSGKGGMGGDEGGDDEDTEAGEELDEEDRELLGEVDGGGSDEDSLSDEQDGD
ncbi:hypothetical protein LTR50_005346 [Elasticomyces elasticus]|nr:hypothetical protein LTR50_005346 [Elasticomyces elasticus]